MIRVKTIKRIVEYCDLCDKELRPMHKANWKGKIICVQCWKEQKD